MTQQDLDQQIATTEKQMAEAVQALEHAKATVYRCEGALQILRALRILPAREPDLGPAPVAQFPVAVPDLEPAAV